MKKSIFLIFVLAASLLLVACDTDNSSQDTTDQPPIEDDLNEDEVIEDEEVEFDIEEEPVEEDKGISEDEDRPNEDGFAYTIDNIEEFELEIELINDQEIDYDFDRSDNEARVTREGENQMNLTGEEAREEVFNLLENIEVTLDRSLDDMVEDVVSYLNISREDIDELDLQIEFLDGKEIDFKYDREGSANEEIKEFNLEIDFWDGSEWNFDYDLDDNEFEIEGRENIEGEEARARIEELIDTMDVSMDRSIKEIKDNLFDYLDINEEDVEDFDLDIEYVNDAQIDIKVHY